MGFRLIPRLNYRYSVRDIFSSLLCMLKKTPVRDSLVTKFRTKNIFFVNNARTGIRLVLSSLGLPRNAKIGVQVYNCRTVFNAIQQAGFLPIFIDINTDFKIDIKDLGKKLKLIDALVITHTFGIPCNIKEIKNITKNIPVIEDCAHSYLSDFKNELTGTFGDASIFSFGNGKFLSAGSGGFVVINNSEIVKPFIDNWDNLPETNALKEAQNIARNMILNLLHLPFIYKTFTNYFLKKMFPDRNNQHLEKKVYKSNYYLFYVQNQKVDFFLKKQKSNYQILKNVILKSNIVITNKACLNSSNGFMLSALTDNPEKILESFRKKGIELGQHFSNSINWAKEFGYELGACPNAESIVTKLISFPCHYRYNQISRLCRTIQLY